MPGVLDQQLVALSQCSISDVYDVQLHFWVAHATAIGWRIT